jgi:aspartate kinase
VIVLKFGGTSVGDAEAIGRTAGIVRSRADKKPIVVVSAMAGVTNGLLAIGEQSAKGHLIGAVRAVEAIRQRHIEQAEKLMGSTEACADLCGEMSALCDELAHLAEALSTLGDATPRSFDLIASFGEQLSSMLVAATLRHNGLPAVHVDGRQVMITDDQFMKAEPQPELIAEAARAHILSQVTDGKIPVLGGFIGSVKGTGITTTLGRGGGDYSASLVGAAIRAEAIEIWTDVDGMLTADPRVVPNAKPIERIGFDEASELASFGAKVLHPSTIAPAVRLGIPVLILNSKRPQGSGTVITFEAPRRGVSAIAGKNDVTLIRVGSPRMLLTDGFMRALFEVFARHRTSIDVVATSEVSVSVTIDDSTRLQALLPDLRNLGDVAVERNRGIVAIVGAALREGGSHMAKALAALGDVNVHMLSLSATGINLTIVVDDDQVKPAMKRLHDAFFGAAS